MSKGSPSIQQITIAAPFPRQTAIRGDWIGSTNDAAVTLSIMPQGQRLVLSPGQRVRIGRYQAVLIESVRAASGSYPATVVIEYGDGDPPVTAQADNPQVEAIAGIVIPFEIPSETGWVYADVDIPALMAAGTFTQDFTTPVPAGRWAGKTWVSLAPQGSGTNLERLSKSYELVSANTLDYPGLVIGPYGQPVAPLDTDFANYGFMPVAIDRTAFDGGALDPVIEARHNRVDVARFRLAQFFEVDDPTFRPSGTVYVAVNWSYYPA